MIKKNNQNGLVFRDKGRKYRPVNLYKKDKKIAGYKQQELSGISLSQTDTYNDSAFMKINGKSEQVQTTQGKNLLSTNVYSSNNTLYGVLFPTLKDLYNSIPEGTAFTVSFKWDSDGTNIPVAGKVYFGYSDGSNSGAKNTFVKDSRIAAFAVLYASYADYGATYQNFFDIQLELGSTATPYEPFVPNSPSPDYPSQINSVENFDLISTGKNLFDGLNNKWINLNGTINKSYPNSKMTNKISISTGTVTLSWLNNAGGSNAMVICFYDNSNVVKGRTAVTSGNKVTVAVPLGTTYMRAAAMNTIINTNIQLEIGNTATTYEPYKASTINFPYTLRSLPDETRDYIEIDNTNKTAKLVRNVGERVFTGSEVIGSLIDFTNTVRFEMAILTGGLHGLTNKISTHFPTIGTSADETEHIRGTTNAGVGQLIIFWINKTRLTGYSSELTDTKKRNLFKSWLTSQYNAGTPVTVQYQLATPTITDLDYEEIKTYYPYTQIYTNATIQPTLDGTVRVIDRLS